MDIKDDNWLTRVFGYPVCRVELSAAGHVDSSAFILHSGAQRSALYYAKVAMARTGAVRQLCDLGFGVVDVQVTLGVEACDVPRGNAAFGIRVEKHLPEHSAEVMDIASSSFEFSRFHLDPLIPRSIANRVKREWVQSYVRGERGEALYVGFCDGRPVGFLAALEDSGASVRRIDLIAVRRDFRMKGIGQALVNRFFQDGERSVARFEVGTQMANLPSIRFYQKLGFAMRKAEYVLHLHVREGVQRQCA